MGVDHLLHLTRVDVEAAAYDQILDSINDKKITISVQIAHLPRVQPSAQKSIDVFFRPVGVAQHHLRSAHADFTTLTHAKKSLRILERNDLYYGSRQRQSDGS